ncbi:addiction module antidote protein, HigA family [Candidatus Peregrinibacteria bacterium CG11_big_fil_rev_8_21_14_0_20_46_8]|nr:MAG: addiction module antidote protein, HigA family [Candidatus Peregrinibacteria bacterium CG11_big_fil_rev_8_21_14_0_20_46_8]
MKKLQPIHPGEILMEEFLKPFRLSQYRLAKDIHVTPIRISEIIHGKRSISADTALRLSKYFGNSAEFWLNLQAHYDLQIQKKKLKNELKLRVKILNVEVKSSK